MINCKNLYNIVTALLAMLSFFGQQEFSISKDLRVSKSLISSAESIFRCELLQGDIILLDGRFGRLGRLSIELLIKLSRLSMMASMIIGKIAQGSFFNAVASNITKYFL